MATIGVVFNSYTEERGGRDYVQTLQYALTSDGENVGDFSSRSRLSWVTRGRKTVSRSRPRPPSVVPGGLGGHEKQEVPPARKQMARPRSSRRSLPASWVLGCSAQNEDDERQRRGRVQGSQDQLLHRQSPPVRCPAVGLWSEPRLADTQRTSVGRGGPLSAGSRALRAWSRTLWRSSGDILATTRTVSFSIAGVNGFVM
jgi:hypothetical protein